MTNMGKVVEEIRHSLSWTVARLERKSGVCKQTIYKIEDTGKGMIETYQRLFDAMGYELKVERKDTWSVSK